MRTLEDVTALVVLNFSADEGGVEYVVPDEAGDLKGAKVLIGNVETADDVACAGFDGEERKVKLAAWEGKVYLF